MRKGNTNESSIDVSIVAAQGEAKRNAQDLFVQQQIEKAIEKIRALRLAGMINKVGADEVQHTLILALAVFPDNAKNDDGEQAEQETGAANEQA